MRRFITIFLILAFSGSASSAIKYFKADVTRTMIHEDNFGLCMAKVAPSPHQVGLDCKEDWVTFSCSGDFNSQEIGHEKLSAAQLALVTGDPVHLQVDDYRKHNGYCYALRIDNALK